MKSKIEIIEETVAYYSEDTTRRGYEYGECLYMTEGGKKCAVGRCMNDYALGKLKGVVEAVDDLENFQVLLKPEYRGHSIRFWGALQGLHDANKNWNVFGLTSVGKVEVEELKKGWK